MFRKVLFWVHLVAGLISGLSIGVMCFTGTTLAFEKELVAWSERDARRVAAPAPGASRLTLDQMQAKLREAQPEARPQSIVLQNDASAAVAFSSGRSGGFYVNPYTGEVRQAQGSGMADFMRTMTSWHRTLAMTGEESRQTGKMINGVCNIAFCVLAITGLYLWMPRQWSWRAVKPVIWFRQNGTSKARDFNWHNVIGFWSAPVLIVLTLTAIPISFNQFGTKAINFLTGTPQPTPGAGPGGGGGGMGGGGFGGGPAIEVPAPSPDAKPLSPDALLAAVQKQVPTWKTITLRTANAGPGGGGRGGAGGEGRGGRGGRGGGEGRGGEGRGESRGARGGEGRGGGEMRAEGGRGGQSGAAAAAPAASTPGGPGGAIQAVTFTVRDSASWPRTANTTISVNPYTGDILKRTGYADMAAPQQVRSWTRFLHTGEALGWWGQLLAGLACLGGVFLVYTGFALSWRRFLGKKPKAQAAPAAKVEPASAPVA